MSDFLTKENLKPLLNEFLQQSADQVNDLLTKHPKLSGVLSEANIQELIAQETEKTKKWVEQTIPAGMRKAISESVAQDPKVQARKQANEALIFAITNRKKLADQGLNAEETAKAESLGLTIIDQTKRQALGVATGVSMGFLVPEAVRGPIIELLRKQSLFATICPVVDNPPPKWVRPREGSTGITFQWNMENTARTASTPTLEQVLVSLTDVGGLVEISNMLLAWSGFDVTGYISRLFARDLAVELDSKCAAGTGSGEPLGIINATGINSVAQAGATLDWQDPIALWHGLPYSQDRVRGVWAAVDAILEGIEVIPGPDGRGSLFFNVNDPNVRGIGGFTSDDPFVQGTIRRRPVYEQQNLGSARLMFFNPDAYELYTGQMEIAASEEAGFTKNQTVFRLIHYFDAKPVRPQAIAVMPDVVLP